VAKSSDEAENFDDESDPPTTFDQETKDRSPIPQDWMASETTPFEKARLNQIQVLISNSKLSQNILLPAIGSICHGCS
jgi:hypothetical protein